MKLSKNSKLYNNEKKKIECLTLKETESSFLSLTSFDQEKHYFSFQEKNLKEKNNFDFDFENYKKTKSERYNKKFEKLSDSTMHSINKSNIVYHDDSFFFNDIFKKLKNVFCRIC